MFQSKSNITLYNYSTDIVASVLINAEKILEICIQALFTLISYSVFTFSNCISEVVKIAK